MEHKNTGVTVFAFKQCRNTDSTLCFSHCRYVMLCTSNCHPSTRCTVAAMASSPEDGVPASMSGVPTCSAFAGCGVSGSAAIRRTTAAITSPTETAGRGARDVGALVAAPEGSLGPASVRGTGRYDEGRLPPRRANNRVAPAPATASLPPLPCSLHLQTHPSNHQGAHGVSDTAGHEYRDGAPTMQLCVPLSPPTYSGTKQMVPAPPRSHQHSHQPRQARNSPTRWASTGSRPACGPLHHTQEQVSPCMRHHQNVTRQRR